MVKFKQGAIRGMLAVLVPFSLRPLVAAAENRRSEEIPVNVFAVRSGDVVLAGRGGR